MTVTCLTHGPMRYRFDTRWHECLGFDGEGCSTQLVYDEDLARGPASGIPNVEVRP
jgi:hypothetical protein